MVFQKNTGVRIVLVVAVLAGYLGVLPARVSAERSARVDAPGQDCQAGDWMWVNGPSEPEIAVEVQQALSQRGIRAIVEARNYGEMDGCGNYQPRGIDFTITLQEARADQSGLSDAILPTLVKLGQPDLGTVKLISAGGEILPLSTPDPLASAAAQPLVATDALTRNVYVIVYDPLLSNGQKLSQYLGWNDHAVITQQTIDFFKQATNNKMNYVVSHTRVVTSGWPELIDGFRYTEQEYLAVIANPGLHHEPTGVDYNKIVNDPQFDICGKVNQGEIDEVWIYNGPWFGFYESTLVGPGAYLYNSGPVAGTHTCSRLIPIMGPSPERTTTEAVHNFTHRAEATMSKVYGGWQQNNTSHNWNKFGLVKAQSPNYSYSGCGSSHYPPNGTSDYNYGNPSSVLSNCDDFANYPNLSDPLQVAQPVSCSVWGCTQLGYFGYWFGHFPSFAGCGPDTVANDWWQYFADPAYALYPSYACQADMRPISGNAGAGAVTLSYTDGSLKSVTADASGNYFLFVSNHWSGTVTPARASFTFTPGSRTYTDVQSDLHGQEYTAERGAFYVNIASGNNNNSCTTVAAPCRNLQEVVNKAEAGDVIKVASGTYWFSTNGSPNVVILNKDLTLSGGWNADFSAQTGASTIDGANVNNGILAISGTVTVENFIVQNSTSYNSGAIYIVNGSFTLKNSTLRNNTAAIHGAGIFLDNGSLTVVNSTIRGNTAGGSGGGIYASNNGSTSVTIQNSTIAYNQASTGGGLSRTNGTYTLTNTILANNTSSTSSPDCSGTIAQANYNIIENLAGCTITSGSHNLTVDPQLDSALTGERLVHQLLAGSPAIDTGTASGCPATDQQGTARPQGNSCDIGAHEYGSANIDVIIGGSHQGSYIVPPQGSRRETYPFDAGPVKVGSTNTVPLISALRDAYLFNGQVESFAQLMGLPREQLSDTYYFPAYNNITLDGQLRFGNVDTIATTVTITIGGMLQGTYTLQPNESKRVSYPLDTGPVVIKSSNGTSIIAALRDAYLAGGQVESFVQLMGLPKEQLSDTYYFPAYNNVTLDGQLRFGNVDTISTDVTVTIGGIPRGTYTLQPNESTRVNYALDTGPVVIHSSNGASIIAALRDAYLVNNQVESFSQLMGLPAAALSDTYVFPAYNNVTLDGQLRFANVDNVATDVTVTIGGVMQGTYTLQPNQSQRVTYLLDSGPVVLQSSNGANIIAALRDAYLVSGQVVSFVQLMGLPFEALSDTYYFPAYNNVTLSGQLRFGVP